MLRLVLPLAALASTPSLPCPPLPPWPALVFLLRHVAATWAPRLSQRQVADVLDQLFVDPRCSPSGAWLAIFTVLAEAKCAGRCRAAGGLDWLRARGLPGSAPSCSRRQRLLSLTRHTQQRRVLRRLLARLVSERVLRRVLAEQQVGLLQLRRPLDFVFWGDGSLASLHRGLVVFSWTRWRLCAPASGRSWRRPLFRCQSATQTPCRRA